MLLQTDFSTSITQRLIFATIGLTVIIFSRYQLEEIIIEFRITVNVLIISVLEIISYITYKVKANLFLKIKIAKMQEEKFQNLLNTVPDKVLICTQVREDGFTKSIYSNYQMNKFFGSNIVDRVKIEGLNPMRRPIFRPYTD